MIFTLVYLTALVAVSLFVADTGVCVVLACP